jgi:putative transposase
MGSVGDCYDKRDDRGVLVADAGRIARHAPLQTRVELTNAIFEYIEVFHNRRRRHSSLGMLTPIEFNNINTTTQAA